ncbi:hypothetical protein [Rothia sp. CCM 9416]|uniref:hypothetical protein n=1 Tax=Rothia sp. CCM 9416 TaxID=3402655 RepID=UPI003ADDCA91
MKKNNEYVLKDFCQVANWYFTDKMNLVNVADKPDKKLLPNGEAEEKKIEEQKG